MRRAPFLPLALFLAACATTEPPDLRTAEVVDLTHAFDENTLYWPSSPGGFELKQLAHGPTAGGYFYSANSFCAPEHGGTHLDAPIHFAERGVTVDALTPRQLLAPAVVLDVTEKAAANPDYRLTADDITAWEARHGAIPAGAIVFLRTGWGARYGNRKAYFGDDTPGATNNLHFPSFGADSARLLVEQRRVAALAVDTPSIDYGPSTDFIVHRIAAERNVPGLENVANLERLPETGAWAIALPIKIRNGSGGPVRIAALLPRR